MGLCDLGWVGVFVMGDSGQFVGDFGFVFPRRVDIIYPSEWFGVWVL